MEIIKEITNPDLLDFLAKGKWTKFLKALPVGEWMHEFDSALILNRVKVSAYIYNKKPDYDRTFYFTSVGDSMKKSIIKVENRERND